MRLGLLTMLLTSLVSALLRTDYARVAAFARATAESASAAPPPIASPAQQPLAVMTAQDVEQQLRLAPVSGGALRDHRCIPGAPGLNGWDFICSYRDGATGTELKIGVRVGPRGIVQASLPHPASRVLPAAASAVALEESHVR